MRHLFRVAPGLMILDGAGRAAPLQHQSGKWGGERVFASRSCLLPDAARSIPAATCTTSAARRATRSSSCTEYGIKDRVADAHDTCTMGWFHQYLWRLCVVRLAVEEQVLCCHSSIAPPQLWLGDGQLDKPASPQFSAPLPGMKCSCRHILITTATIPPLLPDNDPRHIYASRNKPKWVKRLRELVEGRRAASPTPSASGMWRLGRASQPLPKRHSPAEV